MRYFGKDIEIFINNANQELKIILLFLQLAISRRECISKENRNKQNLFPVGDKQR